MTDHLPSEKSLQIPPERDPTLACWQQHWPNWQAFCQKHSMPAVWGEWDTVTETLWPFYDALLRYNAHTNLTRITTPEGFLWRHLADSLVAQSHIPKSATVMDIGSGAGFPAIPLALFRPDLTVIAVESVAKKTRFITEMAQALALLGSTTPGLLLQVITERIEALAHQPQYRGKADIVTARALAALPMLLELGLPLLKTGGHLVAYKTTESLVEDSPDAIATRHLASALGGAFEKTIPIEQAILPGACLVVFRKTGATPVKYPRPYGQLKAQLKKR